MLSEEQSLAVKACRNRPLVLITGPPGTGKTRLISEISKDDNVMLMAPTGTAVDRITQCTGRAALSVSFALHYADKPEYHHRRLIIDEAGMLSTDALKEVLIKLRPASVALIGDPHQLPCQNGFPSLGALLQVPDVPRVHLTHVFRQNAKDTALITCLRTIGTPEFDPTIQDDTFRIVACGTQEECYAKAAELYAQKPSQMLTYTNDAVKILNDTTENKTAQVIRGAVRDGDRVVCTKNMYVKKQLKVANGTCGTAAVGKGVKYDNGYHDKTMDSLFVPCRCMTIHKSQGNEFEQHGIVVLARWNGEPPLELLYTAISRFKKSVTIIGVSHMLQRALKAKFQDSIDQLVVEELKFVLSNS